MSKCKGVKWVNMTGRGQNGKEYWAMGSESS